MWGSWTSSLFFFFFSASARGTTISVATRCQHGKFPDILRHLFQEPVQQRDLVGKHFRKTSKFPPQRPKDSILSVEERPSRNNNGPSSGRIIEDDWTVGWVFFVCWLSLLASFIQTSQKSLVKKQKKPSSPVLQYGSGKSSYEFWMVDSSHLLSTCSWRHVSLFSTYVIRLNDKAAHSTFARKKVKNGWMGLIKATAVLSRLDETVNDCDLAAVPLHLTSLGGCRFTAPPPEKLFCSSSDLPFLR